MSAKNILVDSGEFSGGVRFFSRPVFRSGWFITAICGVGLIAAGFLYIVLAHWNQLSGIFIFWVFALLFMGGAGTLIGTWRMHSRIHEMFLADVVKLDPQSTLDTVLNVAARSIELWVLTTSFLLLYALCSIGWALHRAGLLR